MENRYRDNSRKGYLNFRRVYDITMAILFIGVGLMMAFIDKLKLNLVFTEDPLYRWGFAAICFLYGGFRLYRGIRQEY